MELPDQMYHQIQCLADQSPGWSSLMPVGVFAGCLCFPEGKSASSSWRSVAKVPGWCRRIFATQMAGLECVAITWIPAGKSHPENGSHWKKWCLIGARIALIWRSLIQVRAVSAFGCQQLLMSLLLVIPILDLWVQRQSPVLRWALS